MKTNKLVCWMFVMGLVLVLIHGCKTYYFRENYQEANSILHLEQNLKSKPFLKAHLKNGDVCIFQNLWHIDTTRKLITGNGISYDLNRKQNNQGVLNIPIDSVAIFETNRIPDKPEYERVALLSLLAGVDALIGIICLSNPKACFGSCPTFYLNDKDNFHYADAEGFTNAISPSMEYADIDALNNPKIVNPSFSLTMKNEALETHCINEIKLLAFPRRSGQQIYHSPEDSFYLCENTYPIHHAQDKEGNISSFLEKADRVERFSLADENDLNSKEEIYIDFNCIENVNRLGLILNFRQTLLSTYLFYSSIGFMGDQVGDIYTMMETKKQLRDKFDGTIKLLGGIEVFAWNERMTNWEFQGSFNETGPIAINRQMIPLKSMVSNGIENLSAIPVKLKLILNKGLWRIDYVALTNIINTIIPQRLSPIRIMNKGIKDDEALASILDSSRYLISMPGSAYRFDFIMPQKNQDYALFLYSKGYYLEWMRTHWIKDKNLDKLKQMVLKPATFLKEETKTYKKYETMMEQEFWNSKIDTKNVSYYEH